MSAHIFAAEKSDIAKTVLMPGDPLRAKFLAEKYLTNSKCINEIRGMLGYTGMYKGVPVTIQASGMGVPSMGIYSYELYAEYDVENIIRIGTAGSFSEKIKVRDIIMGVAASTDSNWQHTYGLPGIFAPNASFTLMLKAKEAADDLQIPIHPGNIVTCDVFYEDGEDWWKPWAKMGCLAVEMEAAGLYMNAARLGRNALCLATISNDFLTGEETTAKEREQTFTDMMEIALDVAVKCG
ncbi:MAG: purine-nucleoside phosphorylase [Anaerovoracaceae bacterium]